MKHISILLLAVFCTVLSVNAQRDTIKSVDDIPRFTYQIDTLASVVYNDENQFRQLYLDVEKNYLSLKDKYVILDATLKKDILSTLKSIDLFEKRYKEAQEKVEIIRSLQEKPSQKLTSGILTFTYLNTISQHSTESPEFNKAYQVELNKLVSSLPYELVGDNIKGGKSSMEIYSDNLLIGLMKENIDPASKGGELSGGFATTLISYKYLSRYILPYKNEVVTVYKKYLDDNHIEKKDIWKDRNVSLVGRTDLHPVIITIWDSGVDEALYPGNMFVNENEKIDNIDNDNNGFIDDVNGIAHDLHDNKISGNLIDLSDEQKVDVSATLQLNKGLKDLQTNIDSEEATAFKKKMSELTPDEVKPFIENLSFFGNYAHGTHVAGIAVKDNPAAALQVSRITFDYKLMPEIPTIEQAKKNAIATTEIIEYYKATGVRIVNMSFGGSAQGIESDLEKNGVGKDAEERKRMAREMFDISKKAFYEGMKNAPEILFIAAAGNSDEDSEFYDAIPSSFDLPNILTVGAVDQAGEETSFSSFGDNVDVHANGFNVESYVPGGELLKMSGTSMSCPNAANLAGKILAINPNLNVKDLTNYIVTYSDVNEDGRIILMNPKASIEAVETNKPSVKKAKEKTKVKG